ncbi:probable LRR receptor-like serine/threonine-protein kinase At5g45780 isoform X2 [Olea europaea var. sylvestris]|uniref:probable LRR receptor-like serine/threonine-protein kinase At5g45780 isoform X2 n=1 Tax=Olea europaea var. sylvestris TaxID=158386 RepID=UPI000C1CD5E8|nr:probable LRR receptor-like serine/threonine-protein kinase At5g45780 isoform X2 [Olea europaea var. sylvestris]
MGSLKFFLSQFFYCVAMVGASFSLLSPKGVNFEVAALMSMKREMRDEKHVLDGWDINSVDPCTWNMVGCSSEGFVTSLEMASVGLSGTLSSSIGNLTHLRTMLLQNNQLSGDIPAEIGKLSELLTLDLSGNEFIGQIPSSLGFLTNLTYLRLSRNKLSGRIPKSVADLTGLSFLDLSFNNLSGPTSKILAKDYSVAGNTFLCSSSSQICMHIPKPVNETNSITRVSSHHHHRVIAVIIGVSCTFVVSVMLLVCWVHWYRSRLLFTSYDTGQEKPSLDWSKRMHIALGAARGLLYLHEQCNPKIIHRDVKAANILLDESFEAIVGDFGLAKLLDPRDSHVTTAVRGTVGHIAPEYLSTGQSSEKTDVFGFGILLLELITGQKAFHAGNGLVQKGMILETVRTLYEEKRLEVLVDRDLKGRFSAEELEKAVELALHCTRSNPELRPKMSEVLKTLEGISGQRECLEMSQCGMEPCEGQTFSFSRNFTDVHEDSSFIIEAIELSGPR